MTPLSPATQLAALIRAQVVALRKRQPGSPGRPAPLASDTTSQAPDLASVVALRIRGISPDDPQRERKALRLFLETVLLAELGEDLVNDPAFSVMVDHVQGQLESDPDLAEASLQAARILLNTAPTPD